MSKNHSRTYQLEFSKSASLGLTLLAISASTLVAFGSAKIETIYLNHFPRFFDALSYDLKNALLFLNVCHKGQLPALVQELQTNNKNIFRTLPLLIFAPNLLAKQFGNLVTALPLLLSFALALSQETYKRFNSFWLAVLSITASCFFPGLLDPVNGYAANWLDMPAAMAMGVSALALLEFIKSSSLRSLTLFGLFATITVTSRWSAGPYLAFYAAPVLVIGIFRYLSRKKPAKLMVLSTLLTLCPGFLFATYHIPSAYRYYSTYCFGMGSTTGDSVGWAFYGLQQVFGAFIVAILLYLITANLIKLACASPSGYDIINFACNIWFPISLFVFICFVLKSAQAVHPMVYIGPALMVTAFTAAAGQKVCKPPLLPFVAGLLVILIIWQGASKYSCLTNLSRHPNKSAAMAKALDLTLAQYLATHRIQTYAEFDDERVMAIMESFYKYGWMPTCSASAFSTHESYIRGWFPSMKPTAIAEKMFDNANADLDLVLVHENVDDVGNNPEMRNPYSMELSLFMTKHIPTSPNWRKVAVWEGPFGALAVYQNKLRTKI